MFIILTLSAPFVLDCGDVKENMVVVVVVESVSGTVVGFISVECDSSNAVDKEYSLTGWVAESDNDVVDG